MRRGGHTRLERERGAVADVGERARVRDIAATDLRSGARDIEHAYYGGPGEQMPSSVGPLPPFPLVAPTRPNRNTRGNGRAGGESFSSLPRGNPRKGRKGKERGKGTCTSSSRRDETFGWDSSNYYYPLLLEGLIFFLRASLHGEKYQCTGVDCRFNQVRGTLIFDR